MCNDAMCYEQTIRPWSRPHDSSLQACTAYGGYASFHSEPTGYSPYAAGKFLIMRRRELITLLGGAVAGWPLAARAQQPERMRRLALLTPYAESDPEGQARLAALREGLQKLGWAEGRNIRIDNRWGA